MTIYFLRHASAGQPKKDRPEKDEKRGLDPDGIEQEAMKACLDLVKSNPLWRLSMQQHKLWGVR